MAKIVVEIVIEFHQMLLQVKVAKGSPGPNKVYVPTNTVKVAPKKTENSLPAPAASASVPEASAPTSTSTLEGSETNEEGICVFSDFSLYLFFLYICNFASKTLPSEIYFKFLYIKHFVGLSCQNLSSVLTQLHFLLVEGYSIYIRNLPLSVTADQLEVEFKKFGPIKEGGIQVRNKKVGLQWFSCHWCPTQICIFLIYLLLFPKFFVYAASGILFWIC